MLPLSESFPEFTVSELSFALKKMVEGQFSRVRVRGEISGLKQHTSGHVYFALKDNDVVLDGVCWRGTAQKLNIRPQDGMDVIAIGRITTYPGRSKYQIVVEGIELAGEGALLKLLEERKRKLTAEGLFKESRKKALPFLPETIGIVTSPTGAVIKDMLHRITDRFPVSTLLWPVAVQGEGAAGQISRAITGFNAYAHRPDLLIVARGGGSLEDLWAFNEEEVVRAVAESEIPVISAVGHETDVTLVDFAADKRAPTPTAAAEFAVPVRSQLSQTLLQYTVQLSSRLKGKLSLLESQLEGFKRGFPPLDRWIEERGQRVDDLFERLLKSQKRFIESQIISLTHLGQRLLPTLPHLLDKYDHRFQGIAQLLESYSYTHTLKRGFSYVTKKDNTLVPRKTLVNAKDKVQIHFYDGEVEAEVL